MTIKVLGTGCQKCTTLANNTKAAIEALGIAAQVEKVEDIKAIMSYGVMQTPALVVDEQVRAYGKVLSVAELEAMLKELSL